MHIDDIHACRASGTKEEKKGIGHRGTNSAICCRPSDSGLTAAFAGEYLHAFSTLSAHRFISPKKLHIGLPYKCHIVQRSMDIIVTLDPLQLGLGLRLLEDGLHLGRLHDVALNLELARHE